MKLAKVLMILVGMLVIGAVIFVVKNRGEHEALTAQMGQDDFLNPNRVARRGDDPTYSEEIRKNTALTMQTKQEQAAIKTQIAELERKAAQQQAVANRELQQQLRNVSAELAQLKQAAQTQDGKAAESLKTEISAQLNALNSALEQTQTHMAEMKADAEQRIAELQAQLAANNSRASADTPAASSEGMPRDADIDVALLPPTPSADLPPATSATNKRRPYGSSGSVTLPYGRSASTTEAENGLLDNVQNFISQGGKNISGLIPEPASTPSGLLPQPGKPQEAWPTVFPVYTLPPNTILSQSKLITPIIGRVPLGKQNVTDPFFFKVEIGSQNLAANGHQIPGIAKMIASGYATGIREQQCVRGYIDSMTFIFIDGRIVTAGKASGEGTSNSEALGYLTDPWGKPCISGRYINNAGDYLKSRGAAAFIEAAAEGLSQSQTSYKQNADGNYQAVVDGNMWNFVLGRGIGGSASELANYIRERTDGAFDVVYVPQGGNVQIMLDKMIPIDYDANARKVNYYAAPAATGRLD